MSPRTPTLICLASDRSNLWVRVSGCSNCLRCLKIKYMVIKIRHAQERQKFPIQKWAAVLHSMFNAGTARRCRRRACLVPGESSGVLNLPFTVPVGTEIETASQESRRSPIAVHRKRQDSGLFEQWLTPQAKGVGAIHQHDLDKCI